MRGRAPATGAPLAGGGDGRGRVRDGVLGLDKVRDKLLADLTEERVEGEDLRNCIFGTGRRQFSFADLMPGMGS